MSNTNFHNGESLNDFFIRRNNHLMGLIESAGFSGYSLYDSNNSVLDFTRFGHSVNFAVNQVVKRGPSWLRKVIGVSKGVNPKLLGLYLMYSDNPLKVDDCIDLILNSANQMCMGLQLYMARAMGHY